MKIRNEEILSALDELLLNGRQMSNVLYNLRQTNKSLTEAEQAIFKRLYQEWDEKSRNLGDFICRKKKKV